MKTYVADFHMVIFNGKTNEAPTPEDIKYIMEKFSQAIHERGLVYGGGCELREAKETKNEN